MTHVVCFFAWLPRGAGHTTTGGESPTSSLGSWCLGGKSTKSCPLSLNERAVHTCACIQRWAAVPCIFMCSGRLRQAGEFYVAGNEYHGKGIEWNSSSAPPIAAVLHLRLKPSSGGGFHSGRVWTLVGDGYTISERYLAHTGLQFEYRRCAFFSRSLPL